MKEEFLHFIWKNRLFDPDSFISEEGHQIKVISTGDYNRDSGPDFFNARLQIGNTMWAGNIEIHLKSSHWELHGHHLDNSYNNVILHVVQEYDGAAYTSSGIRIETAVMNWKKIIYEKYQEYINAPGTIACLKDLHLVDYFHVRHWITGMAAHRLEEKSQKIRPVLKELHNDWEETLYRLIARYYGMNVNSEPFYMLASRTPLKIIKKHSDNLLQVEALLYGQAGMLEDGLFRETIDDQYYKLLVREYTVLAAKYSLRPIDGWIWKFHRMRPSNFPTIRISQLAALLTTTEHLFAIMREAASSEILYELFNRPASSYWDNHYKFSRTTSSRSVKSAGSGLGSALIINCVVPLIFLYGRETSNQRYCDRAINLIEGIVPEKNRVTREWESAGIVALSAFDTQGLIGLSETMCKIRACLDCQIGCKLISLGLDSDPRIKMVMEAPDNN